MNDAKRDQSVIEQWSRQWPDANIGVACGPSSLVVIDIDPRNGGDATLAALEAEHGELPETVAVKTGGDGRHYYYRAPEGVEFPKGKLGDGVDVQAGASYVVAPPSIHASGESYEWRRHPDDWVVEPLPGWVRPAMQRKATGHSNEELPESSGFAQGKRNVALTSLAGKALSLGFSESEIKDFLVAGNARMPSPLPEDEVAKIARSIASREPDAQTPARFESDFGYTSLANLRNQPPIEWMVEGLLPTDGWTLLYGPPDAGKTFVGVAIAACVATGTPFVGRAVKQGSVIYVGERLREIGDRIESWAAHHRVPVPEGNLHFCSEFPQLNTPRQVEAFCALLNGLNAPVSLVVFDTLSRAITGLDETSTAVASQAVAGIDLIRNTTGAAVLVIHHTVKMTRSSKARPTYRGNNVIEAGCHSSIYVDKLGKDDRLLTLDPWRVKGIDPQPVLNVALAKEGRSLAVSGLYHGSLPTTGSPRSSAPPVDRAEDLRSALEAIAPNGDWVAKADLVAAFEASTGLTESSFGAANRKAKLDGLIEVEYTGGKNARFRLLQPTAPSQASVAQPPLTVVHPDDEETANEAVTPVAA